MLKLQPRAYAKPRIKITVATRDTKLKLPVEASTGLFAERVCVFALQVEAECRKHAQGRTMRGEIGLDEATSKLQVVMWFDKQGRGPNPLWSPSLEIKEA